MKALQTEPKFYSTEFKEKLIVKVVYQNQSIKLVARDHDLPNVHMLSNRINLYKKELEKGAVSLLPMDSKTKVIRSVWFNNNNIYLKMSFRINSCQKKGRMQVDRQTLKI